MRIRVLDFFEVQQNAASLQKLDDLRIRFEHSQTVVFGKTVLETSGIVHVAGLVDLILHSGVEVVCTMGWCRVYGARALIHRDVVSQHAKHFSIGPWQEWMIERGVLELASRKARG